MLGIGSSFWFHCYAHSKSLIHFNNDLKEVTQNKVIFKGLTFQ